MPRSAIATGLFDELGATGVTFLRLALAAVILGSGAAFGAIQQMPQIIPGLKEVQAGAEKAGAGAVAGGVVGYLKDQGIPADQIHDYQKAYEGGGAILNVIANYAWTGSPGVVHSASAKAGVLTMTRTLAVEWARRHINVNAIAPGYIDTDMVAAVPADVLEKIVAKIPVGRLGRADEIARGVTFLCAEDGGFITGSTLSINGGQHMY